VHGEGGREEGEEAGFVEEVHFGGRCVRVEVEVEFVRLSPLWMAELSKQMSLERFVFPFFSLHFISFLLSQYLVFFIYKPHP
jgi:hypothetical protein